MTRGSRTRSVKPRSYGEHVATVGAHIIREKDYEPIVSEDTGDVGVEKRSEQTIQTRHSKASQSHWF